MFNPRVFSIFLPALMLFASCDRNQGNGIPLVNVNYRMFVSTPEFAPLQAIGGYVYISGGSKGIIIYRFTEDQFLAFDRHCTFQPNDGCRVTVDNTDITAVDGPCCDSEFLIIDGSVVKGPASLPLKQYQTSFDGNTLWITN